MNDFKKRFKYKWRQLTLNIFHSKKTNDTLELNLDESEDISVISKSKNKTRVNIEALGKTWNVVFKKGVPYLNYFNIFYALPKRITLYLIVIGFSIFIGCGIPLSYDYLFKSFSWYQTFPFEVAVTIAWVSISGLLLVQAATTGYAYLSKESLVKARIERSNRVAWLRYLAFALITVNVLFTIVTLLSIPYDFSSHALTWTSLGVSIGLGALTAWVYKYQKSLLQRQAFLELQAKSKEHIPVNQTEMTSEQELSPFLYLDEKSVLKNKEYVKQLDKVLANKEKTKTKELSNELEISWLERTRVWNWKIVKKLSAKVVKYDFLDRWVVTLKKRIRKFKNGLRK